MSRVKGTLVKRGDWYSLRYMLNGKIKVISLGTKSLKEAEKKRIDIIGKINSINDEDDLVHHVAKVKKLRNNANSTILSVSWRTYEISSLRHTVSDKTLELKKSTWNKFINWIHTNYPNVQRISNIEKSMARGYLESLEDMSPKTWNIRLAFLREIFRTLSKRDELNYNPFDDIPKKRATEINSKEVFTEQQLKDIFAVLNSDVCPVEPREEYRLLFIIGLYTGLRLGDACCLSWNEINLDKGLILVIPRKTRNTSKPSTVRIPILPQLLKELKTVIHNKNTNLRVLPTLSDSFERNSSNFTKKTQLILTTAGIETKRKGLISNRKVTKYGFHSLRHGYVTAASKAGIPLEIIRHVVGHSNQKMTELYSHLPDDIIINSMKNINPLEKKNQETHECIKSSKSELFRLFESLNEEDTEKVLEFIKSIKR